MKFTTDAEVRSLPPGEHWDAKQRGLSLRVRPSGVRTWFLCYRHARRYRRFTIGRYPEIGLAEARKRALAGLRDGDPAGSRVAGLTFGALADRYLTKWAEPRKKSWQRDKWMVHVIYGHAAHWQQRPVADITRGDVRLLLEKIPGSVFPNRVRSLLSKIFAYAVQEDLVSTNPVTGTGRNIERSRDRVLTDSEIILIWRTGNPVHMLRLLLGARGGEIQGMRQSEIDGSTWTIPPERSKNGRSHVVPLAPLAMEILASVDHVGDRLFAFRPAPVGIDGVRGHDLRRTCASRLSALGVPRVVIMKILNHVDPSVTAIYDRHGYEAEKRVALERWADEIRRLTG